MPTTMIISSYNYNSKVLMSLFHLKKLFKLFSYTDLMLIDLTIY